MELKMISDLNRSIQAALAESQGSVTAADCEGAAVAMLRLRHTYQLDLRQLIGGVIRDARTEPLTLSELLYIVRVADERGMHYQEIIWLTELLRLLRTNNVSPDESLTTGDVSRVCRMLASAYYAYDIPGKAVTVATDCLTQDPNNQGILTDLDYFEKRLQTTSGADRKDTLNLSEEEKEKGHYEALCRNDVKRPVKVTSSLRCFSRTTAIPYYRGKEEVLNYRPRLSLFHDVITETEMEFVKKKALNSMARSKTVSETRAGYDMRISQTAWINDLADSTVRRLSNRVQLITGLSTAQKDLRTDAEDTQVLNYGIGGMYEPHCDFFGITTLDEKANVDESTFLHHAGDRVATWLYYLSDVKAGGSTVFVDLNVTVPVVKGAAAFWYNLKRDGTWDARTRHAGCPVLLGSKWGAITEAYLKLIDQALQVLERVVEQLIRQQVDIDEMQFGFMPGRGTTYAIFIIRPSQEKHLAANKVLYMAFVDLEKVFARVPRRVIWLALRKLGESKNGWYKLYNQCTHVQEALCVSEMNTVTSFK